MKLTQIRAAESAGEETASDVLNESFEPDGALADASSKALLNEAQDRLERRFSGRALDVAVKAAEGVIFED